MFKELELGKISSMQKKLQDLSERIVTKSETYAEILKSSKSSTISAQ